MTRRVMPYLPRDNRRPAPGRAYIRDASPDLAQVSSGAPTPVPGFLAPVARAWAPAPQCKRGASVLVPLMSKLQRESRATPVSGPGNAELFQQDRHIHFRWRIHFVT